MSGALEMVKLDVESIKSTKENDHTKMTAGFLQLDTYFLSLNSHFLKFDDLVQTYLRH